MCAEIGEQLSRNDKTNVFVDHCGEERVERDKSIWLLAPENDQVSISMNTNSAYLLQQMLSGTRVGLHLSTESPCQVFVDTCSGLANKNAQKYLRHEGFGGKEATFTFFEAVKKVYNLAFFSFFVLKEFGKEQSTCY